MRKGGGERSWVRKSAKVGSIRAEKLQQGGQLEWRGRRSREKGKVIDRFRDDLGLTHFTSIGKSTVEIDKAVNQSLEGRVWSCRSGVGRSREGVRRF